MTKKTPKPKPKPKKRKPKTKGKLDPMSPWAKRQIKTDPNDPVLVNDCN